MTTNPAAAVKKLPKAPGRTVKPVAPASVEKMRAALLGRERLRDVALLGVLAYAGLRPGEALSLRWSDIGGNTISVERAVAHGEIKSTKTRRIRQVRLLSPLREDLDAWRKSAPPESPSQLVFPRSDGKPWAHEDRRNWAKRVYVPLAAEAGVPNARMYDLRHSFASLLFQEGTTSHPEIAGQMGHGLQVLYGTYTHTIEELRGKKSTSAEALIRTARNKQARERCVHNVYSKPQPAPQYAA